MQLTSERASSVSAGDTVLFKGYKVGRVESMQFNPVDQLVHYEIFIDAPYHELVNSSVRFWDVSGVSLSADASGFKVETGAMDTILFGGVAFGVPEGFKEGDKVAQNTEFKLHTSYEDILANPFHYGTYYVVSFDQSVKGLLPGAPVEFRGIQIGKVERIMLKEGMEKTRSLGEQGKGISIPILIYIEPGRMELPDNEGSIAIMRNSVEIGVGNGLRATMASGNLITGAKYISFDFFPGAKEASMGTFHGVHHHPDHRLGTGATRSKSECPARQDQCAATGRHRGQCQYRDHQPEPESGKLAVDSGKPEHAATAGEPERNATGTQGCS